jgi:hypothetical protein
LVPGEARLTVETFESAGEVGDPTVSELEQVIDSDPRGLVRVERNGGGIADAPVHQHERDTGLVQCFDQAAILVEAGDQQPIYSVRGGKAAILALRRPARVPVRDDEGITERARGQLGAADSRGENRIIELRHDDPECKHPRGPQTAGQRVGPVLEGICA